MESKDNVETQRLTELMNRNTPFHIEEAMELIRAKACPNTKDQDGNSLLHVLTLPSINKDGIHNEAIKELVKRHHANIDILNANGHTPLQCLMASSLSIKDAMQLVRLGANPNQKNSQGDALLILMTQRNQKNTYDTNIKELVEEYHAYIDITDATGCTPLQYVMNNSFSIYNAMKLVRLRANPNQVNQEGNSLLHLLALERNNNKGFAIEMMKELVKTYGADIDIQNAEGNTPLQCVMNSPFSINDTLQLINLRANPNKKNNEGTPFLHILAKKCASEKDKGYEIIKEVVEKCHADIDIKDAEDFTLLQRLMNGAFSIQEAMQYVRLGANPNQTNKNGDSLLDLLAINAEKDTLPEEDLKDIKELIEVHQAKLGIEKAIHLISLKHLLNKSVFHVETAMTFIRQGEDPNTQNALGDTLLHMLVRQNTQNQYQSFIHKLIKIYYADPNIKNAKGYTPLQCLINDSFDIQDAMLLVQLGANPNVVDNKNKTLLDLLKENNKFGDYDKFITELQQLTFSYYQKNNHPIRNEFVNVLILLSVDKNNPTSKSFFKNMPTDIIAYLLSFLDYEAMGKTQNDCYLLAQKALSQPEEIRNMLKTPGGVNIFQAQGEHNAPTFTLFKSVKTLCLDFENFKTQLTNKQKHTVLTYLKESITHKSKNTLNQFTKQYAIPYWHEQVSLYKTDSSKHTLFNTIKGCEPYSKPRVQAQLT